MTTLVITSWAIGQNEKPIAVTDDAEEAERIALQVAVHTAHTVTVTESPLDLANARLRAKLCPECGSANTRFYYRGSTTDPGDAEPAADCFDCNWGY